MKASKLTGTYFYSYYGYNNLDAQISNGHGTIVVGDEDFISCKDAILEEATKFNISVTSIHLVAFNLL